MGIHKRADRQHGQDLNAHDVGPVYRKSKLLPDLLSRSVESARTPDLLIDAMFLLFIVARRLLSRPDLAASQSRIRKELNIAGWRSV